MMMMVGRYKSANAHPDTFNFIQLENVQLSFYTCAEIACTIFLDYSYHDRRIILIFFSKWCVCGAVPTSITASAIYPILIFINFWASKYPKYLLYMLLLRDFIEHKSWHKQQKSMRDICMHNINDTPFLALIIDSTIKPFVYRMYYKRARTSLIDRSEIYIDENE